MHRIYTYYLSIKITDLNIHRYIPFISYNNNTTQTKKDLLHKIKYQEFKNSLEKNDLTTPRSGQRRIYLDYRTKWSNRSHV